jgi:hypothetical protein
VEKQRKEERQASLLKMELNTRETKKQREKKEIEVKLNLPKEYLICHLFIS